MAGFGEAAAGRFAHDVERRTTDVARPIQETPA